MIMHGTLVDIGRLKHGQKLKIETKTGKRGKMSLQAVSLEVARLFVDFLYYHKTAQLLEASCCDKVGFASFTCCDKHLGLAKDFQRIQARAKKILPDDGCLQSLSPAWWKKLGFALPRLPIIVP